MGDEPPQCALAHRRTNGWCRLAQSKDPLHGRHAFQFEITVSSSERKPWRKITVRACGLDRENVGIGPQRSHRQVDDRNKHVRSLVVWATGRTPPRQPESLVL